MENILEVMEFCTLFATETSHMVNVAAILTDYMPYAGMLWHFLPKNKMAAVSECLESNALFILAKGLKLQETI